MDEPLTQAELEDFKHLVRLYYPQRAREYAERLIAQVEALQAREVRWRELCEAANPQMTRAAGWCTDHAALVRESGGGA